MANNGGGASQSYGNSVGGLIGRTDIAALRLILACDAGLQHIGLVFPSCPGALH
jgi:hypothetical protein